MLLSNRFTIKSSHNNPINNIPKFRRDNLKNFHGIRIQLRRFYPRDVNEEELTEEICRFNTARKTVFGRENPLKLLN